VTELDLQPAQVARLLEHGAWISAARSQVGSRLAVASMAKISRPVVPACAAARRAGDLARKASISPSVEGVSRSLREEVMLGLGLRGPRAGADASLSKIDWKGATGLPR
jgi:hypothetical protein